MWGLIVEELGGGRRTGGKRAAAPQMKSKCNLIPCAIKNKLSRIVPIELLGKLHECDEATNEMAGFPQTADPTFFGPKGTHMFGRLGNILDISLGAPDSESENEFVGPP